MARKNRNKPSPALWNSIIGKLNYFGAAYIVRAYFPPDKVHYPDGRFVFIQDYGVFHLWNIFEKNDVRTQPRGQFHSRND